MELRQLRQFVVLAERLSFRRAAEQLNIAQPPLSVSIAKLEAELNSKLFERHAHGVSLTPAGEAALPFAREALARSDEMREAVGAVVTGKHGQLRVGFVSSASYNLVPRIVARFRDAYPGVHLILEEARGMECIERVEAGALDVGIVRTPLPETASLRLAPIETSELMIAMPHNHRLSNAISVRLEDLAEESFIQYDRSAPGMRSIVLMSCQAAGYSPRVTHTAAQVHTVLSLVRTGLGVALVPGIAELEEQCSVVPLTCNGRAITLGLSLALRPEEPSRLVNNFCNISRAVTGYELQQVS
ncbi:MAG TPA: LysR family transcriptional regulator [Hyphomonadaceae bacterium]|nr:LysR family transcriptional regulator [Hyphomonadaceae bacterium]HPN04230.1 LysR family transcriptional regulator [Hyphomonadaceae bacterium]